MLESKILFRLKKAGYTVVNNPRKPDSGHESFFIEDNRGVSLGRISLFNGVITHQKFYQGCPADLNDILNRKEEVSEYLAVWFLGPIRHSNIVLIRDQCRPYRECKTYKHNGRIEELRHSTMLEF